MRGFESRPLAPHNSKLLPTQHGAHERLSIWVLERLSAKYIINEAQNQIDVKMYDKHSFFFTKLEMTKYERQIRKYSFF